jgi:PAS domain S-box-containing protein
MSTSGNSYLVSAASQLMAVEVISELLISTSPQKLGEVLTDHLRELTGARTVMVLVHRPEPQLDELLHVSPPRRAELFTPAELNLFCHEKTPETLPHHPDVFPENHPLKAILMQAGIQSTARFSLSVGGELVGLLLLFDLPGIERFSETVQIIKLLVSPIALSLKNALSHFQIEQQARELEKRVEERTAELAQKNAELLESEERFKLAIQATNDGLWEWGIQTNVEFFSPRFCEIVGYAYDDPELPHTYDSWFDRIHPDDREYVLSALNDHLERGAKYDVVYRHRHKSGEYRWQNAIGQTTFDQNGKPVKMVGCISDITERKLAEKNLAESEARYRTILQTAMEGFWLVDAERFILEANDAYCRMSGYSGEELQGMHITQLEVPDSDAETAARARKIVEQGGDRFESQHRRKDGSTFHVEVSMSHLVLDGGGQFAVFIHDITERRLAEIEEAKLQNQLMQSQKMESIGRLAGGVAHDFNNMLTVIMGHSQMGLMHLDPSHPVCADLAEIRKSAERSADLTRQLLAFARRQTVAPKTLDLNDTVHEMLKMLQRLIGEDIELVWRPAPGLWQVRMDPSQVDQILANLCVNARDAIDGNGRIAIETANSTIDEEYCAANPEAIPGDYVRLTVSDSGSGMDRETQSHIFEPFFTTKELGKGTGLGLATVYGSVKQNKGFITIYSELGQGTTFSIYLLRYVSSIKAEVQEAFGGAAAPVPRGKETILLVEDEPAILNVTTQMLEKQGYSILKAATPGEAIRLAREHSGEIQLLMTDVVMPEMNGRDLAKNLLSLYPCIKRLFMSGYTADVIASQGVLEEGVHFIQKPFPFPAMAAKVREVLDGNS